MQFGVVPLLRMLVLASGLSAVLFCLYWLGDLSLAVLNGRIADPARAARFALYTITDLSHGGFAAYVAWHIDRRSVLLGALYFGAGGLARVLGGSIGPDAVIALFCAILMGMAQAGAIRFAQLFPTRIAPAIMVAGQPRWRIDRRVLRFAVNPWVVFPLMLMLSIASVATPLRWEFNMAKNLITAGFSLAYVRTNYLQSTLEQRKQIYWIMQGILMILLATIGSILLRSGGNTFWAGAVFMIGQLALVSAVAFAVFYRGAVDPRLVVRRTVAVSGVTGAVVVLFVVVETIVSGLFVSRLGLTNDAAPIIGGVIAALALRPVHSKVEVLIRRFLPGLGGQNSRLA